MDELTPCPEHGPAPADAPSGVVELPGRAVDSDGAPPTAARLCDLAAVLGMRCRRELDEQHSERGCSLAWPSDSGRIFFLAPTDLTTHAIELTGSTVRDDHGHHSPETEGLQGPVPDYSQPRTAAGRRRDLIISALDRVLCLLWECEAHGRALSVADDPPGWDDLTPRERQVARRLAVGATDRDVASALGVALPTAKSHSKAVLAKLALHSRHELRYILPPSTKG